MIMLTKGFEWSERCLFLIPCNLYLIVSCFWRMIRISDPPTKLFQNFCAIHKVRFITEDLSRQSDPPDVVVQVGIDNEVEIGHASRDDPFHALTWRHDCSIFSCINSV